MAKIVSDMNGMKTSLRVSYEVVNILQSFFFEFSEIGRLAVLDYTLPFLIVGWG